MKIRNQCCCLESQFMDSAIVGFQVSRIFRKFYFCGELARAARVLTTHVDDFYGHPSKEVAKLSTSCTYEDKSGMTSPTIPNR